MPQQKLDLVLHPVRMRIIVALSERAMTARELSAELSDVSQASVYRHLNLLAEAGLVTVAAERQVHSVIEKQYTVARGAGVVSPDAVANLTPDEHFQHFTVFVSTLLAMFSRYLEQDGDVDVLADMVGYRHLPLYLTDEELLDMVRTINEQVVAHLDNRPGPGRRRRLLSTVLFPLDEKAS